MKLRYTALTGSVAILLSSVALAQTPATAETSVLTKEQIRAERRADKVENRALAKKVHDAISRTKGINNADIVVFAKARTGNIVLAGMIVGESQDQVAQEAASKVPGVRSVTSKLVVVEGYGR